MKHNAKLQLAAGQVAWSYFEELTSFLKPGTNLLEIEQLAQKRITEAGMKPAFLGYKGYPATTCLSVNSAIVHGIPYDYQLEDGDVIAVDIGINNQGYLIDTARTYEVGKTKDSHRQLLKVTAEALDASIPLCRAGTPIGDIGATIQEYVENAGFAIVKELTGHGVGSTLQEEPSVPNFGKRGRGPRLEEGMVIAIEPITSLQPVRAVILADGWTIAADKNVVSAHFEHTILITDEAPIVLSRGR